MGNIWSPPEETVVLVPPRFSTRGLTRPLEFENPMDVYFGKLFRAEVLQDLHSFSASVGLDVLLAPELPPKTAVHVSMTGSSLKKTVEGGSLNLHLNGDIFSSLRGLGRVCLSSGASPTGYAMLTHTLSRGSVSLTGTVSEDPANHQLGLRASSESVMMGANIPISSVSNFSAWAITHPTPNVTIGVQVAPLQPLSPLELCLSIDKHIPHTNSRYCVSSSLKSPSNELTLGFSQHLVTHRNVYNIFEDKRVKYIANYIDIAVEATSKLTSEKVTSATSVSAGASWQPNKNFLAKLHVSTSQGLVATIAVRNWWVPSVLTSLSAGADRAGQPFLGGRLQISNWLTTAEYEPGRPVSELPTTKWVSTTDINEGKRNFS